MKTIRRSIYLSAINLLYAPVLLAENINWFPKIPDADNISDGSKSMMSVTYKNVTQGLGLLVFIVTVVTFIKFVTTVQHGIEESKKNEVSMVAFGTFAVMGIIYLAMSIASGFVGYTMITKFKI